MTTPVSRKTLQDNRQAYLDEQIVKTVQRFTRIIYAAVIQESATSDARCYVFSDITSSDISAAFPLKHIDLLLSSLRHLFPDCDVGYVKERGIIIGWT